MRASCGPGWGGKLRAMVRSLVLVCWLAGTAAAQGVGIPSSTWGIGFGNSPEFSGLRFNFRDENVKRVNGLNLTLWQPEEHNQDAVVTGLSLGLIPGGGVLYGLQLGIFGVIAMKSVHGISVATLGMGAGEDLVGINLAGLGMGAGKRIIGVNVATLGMGAGDSTSDHDHDHDDGHDDDGRVPRPCADTAPCSTQVSGGVRRRDHQRRKRAHSGSWVHSRLGLRSACSASQEASTASTGSMRGA